MYVRAGKKSRRRRAEAVSGRSALLNNFLIPAESRCALRTGGFIIEAKSEKQNPLWIMGFMSCERRGGNDEKKKAWTA